MIALVANVIAMTGIVILAAFRPGVGIGLALALGRHTFPDRVDPITPAAPVLVIAALLALLVTKRDIAPQAKHFAAAGLTVAVVLAGAFRQNVADHPSIELYSDDKSLYLVVALIPLLLIAPAVRLVDVRVDIFRALIGVPSALALLSIATGATDASGRAAVLGGGPITLATSCGMGILILLHCEHPLTPVAFRSIETPARVIAGFVMAAGIVLSGSRQPLLSLAIVVALSTFASTRKLHTGVDPEASVKRARRLRALSVAAIVAGIAGMVQLITNDPTSRFALLASDPTAELQRSRLSFWAIGIDEIKSGGAFGHGFGSYSISDGAPLAYAHNMVIELLSETGLIVGLTVLCSLAAAGLVAARQGDRLLTILALYAFFGTNFSGDLYNSRYFFFFLLAAITVTVSGPIQTDLKNQRTQFLPSKQSELMQP